MSKLQSIYNAMSPKQRLSVFAVLGLLLALLAIGGCGKSESSNSQTNDQLDRYYTVERGDFNITVLARGELHAIKNYELRFEGAGKQGLRIEHIVEDKSQVKAGDTIISFAHEDYVEQITLFEEKIYDLKVDYDDDVALEEELFEDSTRNLAEALDDADLNIDLFLETQSVDRDKSISTVTQASNAYETAKDALNKYENLDYRSLSKQKQAAIDLKEQEYFDATDEFDKASQELSEARLKDEDTREKAERKVSIAQKKVNNALAAWETARKADRRFRRYDHPQTLRKLTIMAEKTELDLKRYLVKAQSDRVQGERRYRKLLRDKASIIERITDRKIKYEEELERLEEEFVTQDERLNERLTELKDDLAGLILKAPVDGIVTLGRPAQRGKEPKELLVGTSVAPKETVARIPDLSQFLVHCDIPEIYRSRITVDQPAMLKNAALPDLQMQGSVASIANMSQRLIRWDSRSPRIYETKINTDNSDPRLMPGMTVEVEIQVDSVSNVLFVPIEAIYNKEGKAYCKIQDGFSSKETEITTGRASDSYVEVLTGIEAGDVILLHSSAMANGSS